MEVRELRCFVAVAETLHFGRAAERLGIAQPPLSRTIARLERRLGTPLLERSSRRVALTAAGGALLPEARAILGAIGLAERRVAEAVAGGPRLVLAAKVGGSTALLGRLLAAYAATPGAVPVDIELCDAQQARRLVLDGIADAAVLHLPWESTEGLDFDVLDIEGRVLLVSRDHPLASRAEVDVTDIGELPMARWPQEDGGFPEGRGPEVRNLTQLIQLVGLGRTAADLPGSAATELPHDVVAIPIVDAGTVTTVIAWPELSRSRTVADLVRAATDSALDDADRVATPARLTALGARSATRSVHAASRSPAVRSQGG